LSAAAAVLVVLLLFLVLLLFAVEIARRFFDELVVVKDRVAQNRMNQATTLLARARLT
jgi:hypothetical protein